MTETSTKKVDKLFYKLSDKYSDSDKTILKKAYEIAAAGHINQKRESGEPYITHPLHVAIYLSELSMDIETIVSAILHDLIEDTDITYDYIKKEFGIEIADLVNGVTKLDRINYNSNEEAKADAIRKMVIAMSKDIRVLILKLADRLHNIETIEYLNDWKKEKIYGNIITKTLFNILIYINLVNSIDTTKLKRLIKNINLVKKNYKPVKLKPLNLKIPRSLMIDRILRFIHD